MKVAIIGCGLIGDKRAKSLGQASLVACADINIEAAREFSERYDNIPYHSNLGSLLKNSNCDLVILSTSHNSLPTLLKTCLENKKHVLVEKPAARYAEELKGMNELASKNNCKVHIGFNHRYHRAFIKAKEIFESGALGEMMFIRARYGHGGRVGYEKEWRSSPELSGGGELIDQGSHLIDLSRMFLGDFAEVNGIACNYYWNMPVDDNAFITLRTSTGKIAFLQASCTEWKNTFSFEVYGKNGKLEVSGLGGSYGTEKLKYYKMLPEMGPPETISWEYPMADNSWEVEFNEFLSDIRENKNCSSSISDAIENLKIVNKIYKDSGYDHNA